MYCSCSFSRQGAGPSPLYHAGRTVEHFLKQPQPDHDLWRLGLHRAPRGARAGANRGAHAHRRAPAGSRRPFAAARRRRPDQRRPGQCPLPGFAQGGGRRRRCRHQSRRHPCAIGAADLQGGAGRRRAPRGGSGAGGRRQGLRAALGDRGRCHFAIRLRPHQGGRRGGGERGVPARRDLAALGGVRARGRVLQSLRRARAHLARAALDRRRHHAVPAGIRRRRGQGGDRRPHRQGEARRRLRARRSRDHDHERGHGARARLFHAQEMAGAAAVLAGEAARRGAATPAEPAAHPRSGAAARDRQCGERLRQSRTAARSKASASRSRSRSKPWSPTISSNTGRGVSSRSIGP